MIIQNGKFVYNTVPELTFSLLNAMELSTRPDGTIVDKTINPEGTVVMIGDKVLKANTDDRNIHYAGNGDILLDPLSNLHILNTLLGLFLDKLRVNEGIEIVSFYPEEKVDNNDNRMCAHTIKFADGTEVTSEYYYNRCLGLIELIFIISDENVYVRNFDVTPKEMAKIKKELEKKKALEQAARLEKEKEMLRGDLA